MSFSLLLVLTVSLQIFVHVNCNCNYDGQYLNNGVCTWCPAGYYCPSNNSTDPIACPLGTYSSGSSTECYNCSAGYYTPTNTSTSCTICPKGSYCPNGAQAIPCSIGTASYIYDPSFWYQ